MENLKLISKYLALIFVGSILRIFLMYSSYQSVLADRVEVSTPITSWKRAVEGVFLIDLNISPYIGDTFHELPINLYFYKFLIDYLKNWLIFFFIFVDVLTSILLVIICKKQLKHLHELEKDRVEQLNDIEDKKKIEINKSKISNICLKVFAIYLLSPYSILSCVVKSTGVFSNLLVALCLLSSTCRSRILACFFAALLAYNSFYPLILIAPVALIIEIKRNENTNKNLKTEEIKKDKSNVVLVQKLTYDCSSIICTLSIFFVFLISFLVISYYLMDQNIEFIDQTYWFLLTVPDLTPNIGLFWYFFTEMFDHFKEFFLWTFQINAFIYTIPLSITLKKNPYFLFFISLILLTIFKPYPSVSDLALYLALMPQWGHFFALLKQGLFYSGFYVTCSLLAPIMWYMWIVLGTANANFYYGVTLAFNAAQIFLGTDFLFAYMKREFFLDNGSLKDEKNNPYRLKLSY